MHDSAFAEAARPTRCSILRLPLLDYSIGHELLLFRQNNPLLFTKEGFDSITPDAQCAAVIRGVLICSRTWSENKKAHKWLRVWNWFNRNADFPLAIAEFRNYRESGSSFLPSPSEIADDIANGEKKEGRRLGSPFMARLYNFVCALPDREIKVHGESAFDFPMGFATHLYFSHLEVEGSLKVQNENELDIDNDFQAKVDQIRSE